MIEMAGLKSNKLKAGVACAVLAVALPVSTAIIAPCAGPSGVSRTRDAINNSWTVTGPLSVLLAIVGLILIVTGTGAWDPFRSVRRRSTAGLVLGILAAVPVALFILVWVGVATQSEQTNGCFGGPAMALAFLWAAAQALGIVFAIPAVLFSASALRRYRYAPDYRARRRAIAGLVLGCIPFSMLILVLLPSIFSI